jgi:outer membrane protein assembly factor BamB
VSTHPPHPNPPTDAASALLVGGRYRLAQRIGSGGMGVVWLAMDEVLRRRVAVKELHHRWGSSEQTVAAGRKRSLREARAAAALRHPNIVGVYDIVEHSDRPWIVMEFVAGRSLSDVVADGGPLPVDRAVRIGLQLLAALQAAHAAGVTHRDVKPANVLVDDGDVVRLTDFGLASMQDAEALTETGALLGTPGYLAPEQARGLTPGPPADIFGLGATLYFAVEGVGPFHRDGYLPMLAAYAKHDVRTPQRAEELTAALLRLLAADPAKRPTAEQARLLLLGSGVRRSGPSRRSVLAAGAVAAALTGAGLWWGRPDASGGAAAPSTPSAPAAPSRAAHRLLPMWDRDDLQSPVVVGSLLVGVNDGGVMAVEIQTGMVRWRHETSHRVSVKRLGAQRVFVENEAGAYSVLGSADGAVVWRGESVIATGVEGLVLANDGNKTLTAFEPAGGRRLWRLRVAEELAAEFVPGPDGLICGILKVGDGREPWWVCGISRETGKIAWRTAMGGTRLPEALWGDGRHIHALAVDRMEWGLAAIDPRNGALGPAAPFAKVVPGGGVPFVTSVKVVGGLAVLALSDRRMSLDHSGLVATAPGAVRWRRPLLNPITAVTGDGGLLAASYDSVLTELDPATGQVLDSSPLGGPVDTLSVRSDVLVESTGTYTSAYRLRR